MYRGTIHMYLVGFSDDDAALVETAEPLPSFSHEFTRSARPDAALAAAADAIFLRAHAADAKALVDGILPHMGARAELVLFAEGGAYDVLGDAADALSDLWTTPLSEGELAFRFGRWQRERKQAADLWESRQFLDATIDSIPSLVWYKTRDGVHEKVNASFCETVGKTKEQVQGQRHAYIWDVEEDDPACIESENEVMASERTCISEETVQTGGGTRLLTTYKSPLYDLDGTVMGTVGVGIDITQERAYENDLVEKNRTLEAIFTSLDCGVLTHSLDGSRILGVNRTALDILGFESEEDLTAKGFNMIAPTVAEEDNLRLKQEIATLTEVGDSISTEYRVRHEDGELLHVMGNIKLIEKDGERFYQRFLLDITAQKAHEEQKERRTRNLIQALGNDYLVVCSFDLDTGRGEVLKVTSREDDDFAAIFCGEASLQGTIGDYIDARVVDEDKEMLRETLSVEGILGELETRERFDKLYRARRDGAMQFRQATCVRSGGWSDSREVVVGFRNVDQQIREELEQRTLLEEALGNANRANAAKSAFLLNMSHDIRTPMNAIVGFTTLAANHVGQPDKVEGYLGKIKASSDHLLNLINDILDMSRIEQGKVTLDESRCSITGVLDDMHAMLQHEAEANGLALEVDTSRVEHAEVVCDRLKVNQILLNLVGNSIKFTHAGGRVSASVEEVPGAPSGYGFYRIVVEDTGIGMAQDFLQYIFDPFERERTQTISGIQGSGLGMAIVKSLVDMMNGTIEVESTLGEGTRFTVGFTFRIADDGALARAGEPAEAATFDAERAAKCRILLVDDNMLNREIAEDLLRDAGFQVEKAVDGQDALDALLAAGPGHFDVVLMDIQMPVMNGYDAALAIRAFDDAELAGIPILAVTADAFDEDRERALECGMNGHLAKPIEMGKLFGILDALLEG